MNMFESKQRKSSVCLIELLIFLIDFTLADKSASNEAICENNNTRDISYFKVGSGKFNWTEAWNLCNDNGSTLLVICKQQEQTDLANFLKEHTSSSAVVWTSGEKTSFNEWIWINGQPFNSRGVITVPHESYTHVALNQNRRYATQHPMSNIYYLCQYSDSSCNSENNIRVSNGCVRPSDDDRKWYDARYQCLRNGGDLAILADADLDILKRSNELNGERSYWIGLRKNAWYWTRQITEPSHTIGEEVKYSNWSNDSHSLSYECLSIDAWNGGWKSSRCTEKKKVVCQTSSVGTSTSTSTTSSKSSSIMTREPETSSKSSSTFSMMSSTILNLTASTMSSSDRTMSSTSINTMASTTKRTMSSTLTTKRTSRTTSIKSSSTITHRPRPTTSGKSSSRPTRRRTLSTTTDAMSSMSFGAAQTTERVDFQVLLYSGVGAGTVIILICIIVIVFALRYKRKSHRDTNQLTAMNNSEQNRPDSAPNKPANSSANPTGPIDAPVTGADDTRGVYAEISLATLKRLEDGSSNQQPGIVYASLDFQKEPTYQEPDEKRTDTTAPNKTGPIYAVPDTKGCSQNSSGNNSASPPTKVTPQGDVYALPAKNSKYPTENTSGGKIYKNL